MKPAGSKYESLDAVLTELLERHDLRRPDKRALYAYQVTRGELSRIGHSLSAILAQRKLDGGAEGAAFCIYFAERFCECHSGGPWRWDTVLPELMTSRPAVDFYAAVESGLKWCLLPTLVRTS